MNPMDGHRGLWQDAAPPMSFSFRQLRYFVAVAEARQISAAARELYVSQSAVTTAVQDLERQIGHVLFERSSRGVALTATGVSFLPRARQILQMVDEAVNLTVTDTSVSGHARVGVTYTVMAYFLPHHLQQLSALYPNLQVDWQEVDRESVEARINAGELDFGLLLTSNVVSTALQHQTFVHSRRRLWVAPTHPLAGREEVFLADVSQHRYALLTVDEADRTTLAYWGDLRPDVFITTSSIEAIRSIVANGNAVTILSDVVYRPWSLEGKRIETVELRDPVPDMSIGLAWRRGTTFTPAMSVLHGYFHRLFCTPGLPS